MTLLLASFAFESSLAKSFLPPPSCCSFIRIRITSSHASSALRRSPIFVWQLAMPSIAHATFGCPSEKPSSYASFAFMRKSSAFSYCEGALPCALASASPMSTHSIPRDVRDCAMTWAFSLTPKLGFSCRRSSSDLRKYASASLCAFCFCLSIPSELSVSAILSVACTFSRRSSASLRSLAISPSSDRSVLKMRRATARPWQISESSGAHSSCSFSRLLSSTADELRRSIRMLPRRDLADFSLTASSICDSTSRLASSNTLIASSRGFCPSSTTR
mmetsp:Transcript_1254/g.3182  ORF Transcript_1254/g.3182 Transcript_1254/m.3182 type:complete len:275 (-) Transcript_1254:432-1256(-)